MSKLINYFSRKITSKQENDYKQRLLRVANFYAENKRKMLEFKKVIR